jgi:hypothetical protein
MKSTSLKSSSGLCVIRGKKGRELLRAAEQAVTPQAREELQVRLEDLVGELTWKPFGGTGRVAHSAIGATGDALHLAGEPVVNQGDGLIEMMRELAHLGGDTWEPATPREAAARYFGLPADGMAEWDTRKGDERKRLMEVALLSKLLVYPGTQNDETTLVYLDQGAGQHPADFEDTVLSLQRGLKAEIPYLAGQFGHGAGLTLNFSNGGQIIIGRRHPDLLTDEQEDLIGLTVVQKKRASEVHSSLPAYLYAVEKETGKPLAFEASALGDPRWHGLRRICIDYEVGPVAKKVGDRASGGLYDHLNNLLPCPVLPFALRDERVGESAQWRYMKGVTARLTSRANGWAPKDRKNPINVTGPFSTTIDVTASADDGQEYGTVELTAWIIEQENTPKGSDLYGPARAAETWSLTGQMHEAFGRDHFGQKPIELDALKNHLKVNVECDGLTVDAKSDIFTTSRQGTAERRAKKALRDAIDSVLANNQDLRIRDQEIKEEALRRATEGADKELEKALSDFQHLFEREVEIRIGGPGKRKKKKKKRKNGKKPPVIPPLPPIAPLNAEPTFLRFRKVVKKRVRVQPGATASIQLEADAVDGYFPDSEQVQFSTVPDLGSTVRIFARERLSDGRLRVHFRAVADAAPGSAMLTATCLPASSGGPLTDSIELEIVAPSGGGGGQVRKEKRKVAPPHRVLWKDDPNGDSWADAKVSWDEDTVGEFKDGVALVNGDFAPFREMLDQVKVDQRKAIIRLYVPPVVMSLVSIDKSEKEPPKSEGGDPVSLHPDYRAAALRSVALGSVFTIRRLKKLGFGIGSSDADEG